MDMGNAETVEQHQQGDVVNVDGVLRVLVPMNVSGRYVDDVILVPGPVEMSREEQALHELEEREYEDWLVERQFVGDVVGDAEDSSESGDSGVVAWSSIDREIEE